MRQISILFGVIALLLIPAYASAQSPDRITVLDTFGTYVEGEPLFIYGQVASIVDDSFLIMQIINPQEDLCQIQQITPLPNGVFITDVIPLKGRICGLPGEYEVRLFYGDYSKSTIFNVTPGPFLGPNDFEKIFLAQNLILAHQSIIDEALDISSPVTELSDDDLSALETVFVDLWDGFFADELLFEVDPLIRPAISSSLESVQQLLDNDEISFEIAESIDRRIFTAVFYYEIGDKSQSVGLLTDAFVDIRNANPEKTTLPVLTFDQLETTLLNLMKKSDTVMSRDVKHEIAFIFARGTAPVYSDEIPQLIDILSKSRYLDVVSRKDSDLYRLVNNNWEFLKPSLQEKESIEELLASSADVSKLHTAAILLRELDGVGRFILADSEENSELANLLVPDWDDLQSDLTLATSVDDILEAESEIHQMSQIIDISARISASVKISQSNNVNSAVISDWESLLERVENAQSTDEILEIVSAFDQSMTELREKRNPLTLLEFQYGTLKDRAEIQADYENLVLINNALKILNTAKQMESGNPSITRIDRIEVLLTWASETAPKIKSDLDSYNKDTSKIRASDILQRAQSLENLVDLSLTKNRFLPNYVAFTEDFSEKIAVVRDLVIKKDLDFANTMVEDLFDEWVLVSTAYANNPDGSKVGYNVDEIKRIEFREKLSAYSDTVSNFRNSGFDEHASEYHKLMDEAYELIEIANFVDVESHIKKIGDYLSEHLTLRADNIIFDLSFDAEKDIWIINGATEKSRFESRENLYVTVYKMDGSTHSSLKFTDTRQGNFYTQWNAPTDPGLYVVSLQYLNSKATQIAYIEEEFTTEYAQPDLDAAKQSRVFDELRSFAKEFGGANFDNNPRITSIINEIKSGIADKNTQKVKNSLDELRKNIERYLPIRDPSAPIEAAYDGNKLVITGRVLKAVEFSEDLFIDVYDQQGDLVKAIALRDDPTGLFNEVVSEPFDTGIYVVRLQYHDLVVTDFFNVP